MSQIEDLEQRIQAIDYKKSFIVQAPAGSGKTGLLIQRYLVLLALVNYPEEIVAITFTRKAAAEMRQRVLEALKKAQEIETPPQEAHERHTWELACKAYQRDKDKGWFLLEYPARLRIQTIDAFCAYLTKQMPLLARFGAQPTTTDDPRGHYQQATQLTIDFLKETEEKFYKNALIVLLNHLDNNQAKLHDLLVDMLAKRDQWLRRIGGEGDTAVLRPKLEYALLGISEETIYEVGVALDKLLYPEDKADLVKILQHAAGFANKITLTYWLNQPSWPEPMLETLEIYKQLADFLLSKEGSLRKRFDKNLGIRPTDKEIKALLQSIMEKLNTEETIARKLQSLRNLPPIQYDENNWQVLQALIIILRLAAARLVQVFQKTGEVDFIAVSNAALQALGTEDSPTDLALALDYRIQHLLIDEFQDTSLTQFQLLESLTRGWLPDDGRTLFLVGDPMQSIYRFREAEVGLYLQARRAGIGNIILEPLTLTTNFRSAPKLVQWFNQSFVELFPKQEEISLGAVSYSQATIARDDEQGTQVDIHALPTMEYDQEAEKILELIEQEFTQEKNPEIAVLVRSRGHLRELVPHLKAKGLRFRAVELESLANRPVIQDLLSLTRALLYLGDRSAWLALLHGPWCGLTLADLQHLLQGEKSVLVWDCLWQQERLNLLPEQSITLILRIRTILENSFNERFRKNLRSWIEGTWLALGGPAVIKDKTALEETEVFFNLLEKMEQAGEIDIYKLQESIEKLYALPDSKADDSLQIMTIHKSKGLEFNCVIVPGLGRPPRTQDRVLLRWLEQPEKNRLLLSPIKASAEASDDTINQYIKSHTKLQQSYEDTRLLYVAATRAKKRLHLIGQINFNPEKQDKIAPSKSSLLEILWPVVQEHFYFTELEHSQHQSTLKSKLSQQRLSPSWQIPKLPQQAEFKRIIPTQEEQDDLYAFQWFGDMARHVGTVVHRYLQRITDQGIAHWSEEKLIQEREQGFYHSALRLLGVVPQELDYAAQRVEEAIRKILQHDKGLWILHSHQEAISEYALTGLIDGIMQRNIIDRTFVDNNTRWIIDYKTSSPQAEQTIEAFLQHEKEKYNPQLSRYGELLARVEPEDRKIYLGLYFPLIQQWIEWSYRE